MTVQVVKATEGERLMVVFKEGEIVYASETKELWVGDGVTYGGKLVNSNDGAGEVTSVAGRSGDVVLSKADITDFADSDYATAAQGALATSAVQAGDNNSVLVNDAGFITSAPVTSVAGKVGVVTIDKADITDFSEGDYATGAEGDLATSATQPGSNVSTLTNDAGYVTSAVVPSDSVGVLADVDLTGNATDKMLQFNGTSFVPVDAPSGGGGVSGFAVNPDPLAVEPVATAWRGIAIGDNARAMGSGGEGGISASDSAIAIGYSATAGNGTSYDNGQIAIGRTSTASGGDGSVAIGESSVANKDGATAVGKSARADSTSSTSIGTGADAGGTSSVAVGKDANASASQSVAIGDIAAATGNYSFAVCRSAKAKGASSIAIGEYTDVYGSSAIGIGKETDANGSKSVAIGEGAKAEGAYAINIGDNGTRKVGQSAIHIGRVTVAQIENTTNYVAVGHEASASVNAVAIGKDASAKGSSAVVIGQGRATTTANVVIVGNSTNTLEIDGAGALSIGGSSTQKQIVNPAHTTAARPTSPVAGSQVFDTTLNKPVWYTGAAWVDAAGTTV